MSTFKFTQTGSQIQNDLYLIENGLGETFSSIKSYSAGDLVIYDNKLWRCINYSIGEWEPSKWILTTISNELKLRQNPMTQRGDMIIGGESGQLTALSAGTGTENVGKILMMKQVSSHISPSWEVLASHADLYIHNIDITVNDTTYAQIELISPISVQITQENFSTVAPGGLAISNGNIINCGAYYVRYENNSNIQSCSGIITEIRFVSPGSLYIKGIFHNQTSDSVVTYIPFPDNLTFVFEDRCSKIS